MHFLPQFGKIIVYSLREELFLMKSKLFPILLALVLLLIIDAETGFNGWSLNYAIPIVCGSSILALLITVWSMRMEVANSRVLLRALETD